MGTGQKMERTTPILLVRVYVYFLFVWDKFGYRRYFRFAFSVYSEGHFMKWSIAFSVINRFCSFSTQNCFNIKKINLPNLVPLGYPIRAYVTYLYHKYFTKGNPLIWFLKHNVFLLLTDFGNF